MPGTERTYSFESFGGQQESTAWVADRESAPVVLIVPALGLRASYYAPVCEALAANGLSASAVDLIGAGSSPVRASRAVDWGYPELIDHVRAASEAACAACATSRLLLLGHSIGGHISLMLAGDPPPSLRGVVLVAAGSPWWRGWSGVEALRVRLSTGTLGLITRAFGYFPGPQVGFGGREAKTLMLQWCEAGRSNRFEGGGWSAEPLFAAEGPRALSIRIDGDSLAPEGAVRALTDKTIHRGVESIHWAPVPEGVNHNRWPRNADFVVERVAEFSRALEAEGPS